MWYSVDLTYDVKQQRVRHIVASRAAPLEIILPTLFHETRVS